MIIYKGGKPHCSVRDKFPVNWLFEESDSGYMDSRLFALWFEQVFVKHCGAERPVVLILDNHESHLSATLLDSAKTNNIDILTLPSHTTHILQPLDVACFNHVKAAFTDVAADLSMLNQSNVISRINLPMTLSASIDKVCSPKLIKDSFRKTGIFPLDSKALDWSQIRESAVSADSSGVLTRNAPSTSAAASASTSTPPACPMASAVQHCATCKCHEHTIPNGTHCPTCLNMIKDRHPVASVLKLPDELQELFVIPGKKCYGTEKAPKRNAAPLGRHVTGQEWMDVVREKTKKRQEEEINKEERKKVREERKIEKEKEVEEKKKKKVEKEKAKAASQANGRPKSKRVAGKKSKAAPSRDSDADDDDDMPLMNKRVRRTPKKIIQLDESSDADSDEEKIPCNMCHRVVPAGGDGMEDDAWVQCDMCDSWYHVVCVELPFDLPVGEDDVYICGPCENL